MAIPDTNITKTLALAPDGKKYTRYPDGVLPGSPPGALTMDTPTKTATSITGVVIDGNGSTSYQTRVDGGTPVSGLTKSGLDPETQYSVEWRGQNEVDFGPWTTPVNVTTNEAGGALAQGQRLTIVGTGFGAVASPLPSTSDTFDYQLSDGTLIPDGAGTNWGENGGTFADPFELDNSVVLPGRTFSAKSRGPKAIMQDPIVTGQSLSARSFYSQHWQRFNESLDSPPQPEDNRADKIIRMTDGDSDCGTRVSWEANVWRCYITHPTDYGLCRSGSSSDYVWDQYIGGSPWNTPNTWIRVEMVWTDNGDDSCDVSLRINGKEVHKFTNVFHPPSFVNSDWRQELVGHDISQTNKVTTTLRTWLADHITQGSPARVEFSNNATYNPSLVQKRYYQICESRTDTQVVVDSAMFGDLDLESSVYAHMIKSDDSATTVEMVVGQNVTVG